MDENLSRGLHITDFVFDTAAFLTLESVHLLKHALESFSIVTTTSVVEELEEFAQYDDELGTIAQRVLKLKHLFGIEESPIKNILRYVSITDKELYNLSLSKNIPLITDDTKLIHHTKGKIRRAFSTLFLSIFVESGIMTKKEALEILELMRNIRNWQNNIIYISSKEELNNLKS